MFFLGDFKAGDVIYFPFDTYGSSGESITMSGLAVTDIEIYKNGSTTQRSSDNGYALLDTDGIDFDGTTGLHGFSVDTGDNSDSGFYSAGAQFWVNVNAITVNSQTVRFTYYFTLGRLLRPTTEGRTLDVSSGGEAGLDWANIGSPTTTVGLSGTTIKTATDVETDTQDIQSRIPAALTAGGNMKADALALSGDTTAADNAESFFDGTGYAGTNNVIPTVTTLTGHTPQTGDCFARLTGTGAVTFASLTVSGATTLTGALTATNASNNLRLGTFTVDTNAIAWPAAWDAEVQSECADALNAYDPPTHAELTTAVGSVTLAAAGLDSVLIEAGISAGAGLTNDTGTQLTSINARQALALSISTLDGVLAGAATTTVATKPAGKPSGNTRISATVDADGNRSVLTLKVPD